MKISYNWIRNYLSYTPPTDELANILTQCGLEVEAVIPYESVKGSLQGVVIGKVLSCERHPDSDHLSLTLVDIGQEKPLNIVCGAPNVAKGQKVAVATIGAKLDFAGKELVIKPTKIRGAVSEGMICAEDELGLGSSHAGIMVLDPQAVPGTPAADYFKPYSDSVYQIGLTPNRSDAASHLGTARDVAAFLTHRAINTQMAIPPVSDFQIDDESLTIPVIIEDPEACPRYCGITVSGIQVQESPAWLQNYLKAIDVRPINNIVDITNFVLHETGQPLHAFDAREIKGDKVIVKKYPAGTQFITLDGINRTLMADDLMICNVEAPMCMAGIFGGLNSGVTDKTQQLFLESACFQPATIRKSSKHHGLQTDASFRFERGADISIAIYALQRAAMLIKEIAGGKISSKIQDVFPGKPTPKTIPIDLSYIDKLTGNQIPAEIIHRILRSLGFQIENISPAGFSVVVPSYKTDISCQADVVEEILRIYGYNRITLPGEIRFTEPDHVENLSDRLQNKISDFLTSQGFSEIQNNSLTASSYTEKIPGYPVDENIMILNAISRELNILRPTLVFGGLETITFNINRKNTNLKLYEFGTVYKKVNTAIDQHGDLKNYEESRHLAIFLTGLKQEERWNVPKNSVDVFEIKSCIWKILTRLGFPNNRVTEQNYEDKYFSSGLAFTFNGELLAVCGNMRDGLKGIFDCRQPVFSGIVFWETVIRLHLSLHPVIKEVPKYPSVRRDLALLIDKQVRFAEIKQVISEAETSLLRDINLFDVYEGDQAGTGKKSYAVSLVLQDEHQTLTDKQIDKSIQKIIQALHQKLGATIR
ncbi:MAG: phenylalanine--tRNA ligase subunit beta [Bacteroidetes bacterium]|nr:phenylalanine--tRNA ligase subunit beta [Bacteroidota bacterium]